MKGEDAEASLWPSSKPGLTAVIVTSLKYDFRLLELFVTKS